MKYKYLGQSDLKVSIYCLGSMTWGEASTESEGQWQLDNAIANGINFVDTAEMYPTNPLRSVWAGISLQFFVNWIKIRNV